jgi:hypothetical protein
MAYRRIWEGQIKAEKFYGRWLISPERNLNLPSFGKGRPYKTWV